MTALLHEMFLNLMQRLLRQILVQLRDNDFLHIGMECLPQVGKRARRGNDHQRADLAVTHNFLKRHRNVLCELVLLKIVPVGLFDAAATRAAVGGR